MDWKTSIRQMLDELIADLELPEKSLYLMKNYGRDGKTVTSYSVGIYEPDYPLLPDAKNDPTKNFIVLNVKEKNEKLEFLILAMRFEKIGAPSDAEIKRLKSDTANVHVILASDSCNLTEYVRENVKYCLSNYKSKAAVFGCCSRFNECSDAKKCIHENKLYSKACSYRRNLEIGKIFYGKNKNIDE